MTATISPHFKLDVHAAANPDAVFYAPNARFSVLTPRLIRLEYSPDDGFEDRPSQPFWYRRQPAPDFSVREQGGILAIDTGALVLTYRPGSGFKSETLKIKSDAFEWAYGQENKGNLLGTYRTLDGISGNTPLEPGLLSRDGWALVDDSHTLVFNEDGWLEPRNAAPGTLDLYFFGHGRDYQAALRDYSLIAGSAPMIPRYVLGNWWSRYWEYSQDELQNLMLEFKRREVPLSVCIIDMDWHITNTPYHTGWTGYTWNPELFPDPPGFIAWLHQQGLHTAMNLHPAEGVAPHEAGYPALAKRLGMDPRSKKTIAFDIASPEFTKAYLEVLHHPHEADGVDFWWMDWQQGNPTRLPGLNLLWWINHLHFLDLGRSPERRPFIFSRWGGLGNHRYPIGFSGDTFVSWRALAFQPYFTATAANVGYSWWSHDIGGHMLGVEEPELYLRWVQYGVFSPILRLHATANPYHERRPWGYDAEIERLASEALRLRQRLIPYLYSAAWRNTTAGEALVRPLYHLAPEHEAAYAATETYAFGPALIAAPFVTPRDPDTRLARQVVWLPPGEWFGFWDGRAYAGDAWHAVYGTRADIPVFARAGAIVPLAIEGKSMGVELPPEVELRVFPGAAGSFDLYEDDGESQDYQQGAYARTRCELDWQDERLQFRIRPVEGQADLLPAGRRYRLRIFALQPPDEVRVTGAEFDPQWQYDARAKILEVRGLAPDPQQGLVVEVRGQGSLLAADEMLIAQLEAMLAAFRMESEAKWSLAQLLPRIAEAPEELAQAATALSDSQLRALLEVAAGCGVHASRHSGETIWVIWNPRQDESFRYALAREKVNTWHAPQRFSGEGGTAPRSLVVRPAEQAEQAWRLQVDYGGFYRQVLRATGSEGWAQ